MFNVDNMLNRWWSGVVASTVASYLKSHPCCVCVCVFLMFVWGFPFPCCLGFAAAPPPQPCPRKHLGDGRCIKL